MQTWNQYLCEKVVSLMQSGIAFSKYLSININFDNEHPTMISISISISFIVKSSLQS